jgi:hypothetical protein
MAGIRNNQLTARLTAGIVGGRPIAGVAAGGRMKPTVGHLKYPICDDWQVSSRGDSSPPQTHRLPDLQIPSERWQQIEAHFAS